MMVRRMGIGRTFLLALLLAAASSSSAQTVPGDIDDSGAVNALDIQLVINGALGIDIAPNDADINGDSAVNALDIQLVINAALGIIIQDIPPTAAFTMNQSSGEAPLIVQFEDQSAPGTSAITSWSWNFGDAASGSANVSAEQNPSHVYNNAGTYAVTLTVTTSVGSDDTQATVIVTVLTPCNGCTTETIMLPGNVPLEMVYIEPGTFMMGRYPGEQDSVLIEDPQHQVTLTQGFWMGKYELTKAQWTAVMGTTPWSGQSYVLNDPNSPAVYVSWNDAQAFITALNSLTGKTFRLPSEAEWEYACRAGTTTRFYWGDDPSYSQIGSYAWNYYNAYVVKERYAHVVGQKLPNAWGLYDMSGNVLEWCEDDRHANYIGAPMNGAAWVDSPRGSYRLQRDGSWGSYVNYCRSANRGTPVPGYTSSAVGFRILRTP